MSRAGSGVGRETGEKESKYWEWVWKSVGLRVGGIVGLGVGE